MPSPAEPNEMLTELNDAQELARQRALALELRDERISHRLKSELLSRRQRSRRAADLLRLADAIAHSYSKQHDYIMQPREVETASDTAEIPAAQETTKS
jgi:hypothetical protein